MNEKEFKFSCPLPISDYSTIQMAHGGGGRLTHELIGKVFTSVFQNPMLHQKHDGAVSEPLTGRMAMTTDSYVVKPLFFPGGNIGTLAINGTINDLAMCGARPLYITAGFILEEGFPLEDLWQIVQSMQQEAEKSDVQIVAGDTKVVDRGKGDGVYINTAGFGLVEYDGLIGPGQIREDDVIIINGDIGRHGIAIMAQREGLEFECEIDSDCAPLWNVVQALLEAGIEIHCLRDLTRGGLSSTLVEISEVSGLNPHVRETDIPVCDEVRGVCEILGYDPLYVANEGRFAAFVPSSQADAALEIMRQQDNAPDPQVIGTVRSGKWNRYVTIESSIGAERILTMLSGEQLPRIC